MKKHIHIIISILSLMITTSTTAQIYKIGDVITNTDGSKGVVFWLHPDGSGGWMAALEDLPEIYQWGTYENIPEIPDFENLTVYSVSLSWADTAGYNNTKAIRDFYKTNQNFAAQVVDFENGWYLPAAGQLIKLFAAVTFIQKALPENKDNITNNIYWTSSENNFMDVLTIGGMTSRTGKLSMHSIRPVHSFLTAVIPDDTTLVYQWNTGAADAQIDVSPAQTTEYTVTISSATGCSGNASKLIFAGGNWDTIRASVKQGEIYSQYGFNESVAGTYTHTLTGTGGCNQTITLILKVLNPISTTINGTGCAGEAYTQYNFTEWETGTYTQRWTGSDGSDSIVTLNLQINPVDHETFNIAICRGENYTGQGFSDITTSGTHTRRLENASGCDSIITLNLSLLPDYHFNYYDTIGNGQVYTKHGFNVTTPGTHILNLRTTLGCDSIITLDLISTQNNTIFKALICEGETYTEHGFNASTTGTYFQHLQNATGLDSTVVLHLTVNPTYQATYNGALCPGKTYTEHGFNVSVPGVYHRNLQSATGCDSTITLNLITAPIYNEVIDANICEGEAYTQNGFNETQAGTHYLRLHSASGCDSIFTLNLTVDPSYYFEKSATICQGESYDFKGMILHETGTYYHNLQTATGCDSIYELDLTVKPAFSKFIDTRICEGVSYTDHGFNVSVPGIHIRRAASNNGCDSVFTLQLEIESIKGTVSSELLDCATHEYGFTFDNQTDTPVTGYTWDLGDGTVSPEQAPTHNYAKEGNYPVNLTVATGNGCETTASHLIDVPYYVNPMPIYSSRKGVSNDDGLITFWTDLKTGLKYQWDLGDGTSADTYKVEHRYNTEDREYYEVRLTVNNSDDCLMEQEFQLKTFKIIYPPNTFSPNGDGINDLFMKGYRVQILNRNGAVIFKGEDGWDGTRKGEQATEDTYFYEVHYLTEEGEKNKTGYITLIR